MDVTVTVDLKPNSPPHRLNGRAGEIVLWLIEIGEALSKSDKGQIEINYSGESLIKKFLQVEERRGRK